MVEEPGGRRRTPTQERSRETFDAVCAAASELLQEGGIANLTTNAVARRAGVSITAVYAYFEDKWAIVRELFLRFEKLRGIALAGLFDDFETVDDWAPIVDRIWDAMARFRAEVPGAMALRTAMNSNPDLARLDFEDSVRTASGFAEAMRARQPRLTPEEAQRASWAVTIAAGVLIDDAVRDGRVDWDRLDEGKRLIKLHLASYLDREP